MISNSVAFHPKSTSYLTRGEERRNMGFLVVGFWRAGEDINVCCLSFVFG
jgi:hypothetical protein